jgi:hypothetical protein
VKEEIVEMYLRKKQWQGHHSTNGKTTRFNELLDIEITGHRQPDHDSEWQATLSDSTAELVPLRKGVAGMVICVTQANRSALIHNGS